MFGAFHRTVVMAVAKSGKKLTCRYPALRTNRWQLRTNRWQVGDTILRLAGGDLGDRAKQPSALSRTLPRAFNMTVPTVIAGQIRTTVEQPCREDIRAWPVSMHSSYRTVAGETPARRIHNAEWLPSMAAIHALLPSMTAIYGRHLWPPSMAAIFGRHLWPPSMADGCRLEISRSMAIMHLGRSTVAACDWLYGRLYGCSYMLHLSGDISRDRQIKAS